MWQELQVEARNSYPRGSLRVKVRLRLGLAWLMGIVLPCNGETAMGDDPLTLRACVRVCVCACVCVCVFLNVKPYVDLVAPAGKVSEGLDRHAHVGLEGQRVHSSRVYGLDGGQLLLVLLHQVCQPWGGGGGGRKPLEGCFWFWN